MSQDKGPTRAETGAVPTSPETQLGSPGRQQTTGEVPGCTTELICDAFPFLLKALFPPDCFRLFSFLLQTWEFSVIPGGSILASVQVSEVARVRTQALQKERAAIQTPVLISVHRERGEWQTNLLIIIASMMLQIQDLAF